MFCKNCGTENPDGSAFCRSCGTPLGNRPSSTPPNAHPTSPSTGRDKRRSSLYPAIAALALVLVLAGIGAFLLRRRLFAQKPTIQSQPTVESSEAASDAEPSTSQTPSVVIPADESDASQVESVNLDGGAQGSTKSLVGMWVGTLGSKRAAGAYCYGAQLIPLTLNVKSVDEAGKMKADITLCYHNHAIGDNEIDSDPGDTALTFSDVTIANYGGNIEYHGDISTVNREGSVAVVFHVRGSYLTATVTQTWVDPDPNEKQATYEYTDNFDLYLSES